MEPVEPVEPQPNLELQGSYEHARMRYLEHRSEEFYKLQDNREDEDAAIEALFTEKQWDKVERYLQRVMCSNKPFPGFITSFRFMEHIDPYSQFTLLEYILDCFNPRMIPENVFLTVLSSFIGALNTCDVQIKPVFLLFKRFGFRFEATKINLLVTMLQWGATETDCKVALSFGAPPPEYVDIASNAETVEVMFRALDQFANSKQAEDTKEETETPESDRMDQPLDHTSDQKDPAESNKSSQYHLNTDGTAMIVSDDRRPGELNYSDSENDDSDDESNAGWPGNFVMPCVIA